jgi:hypothetical protein
MAQVSSRTHKQVSSLTLPFNSKLVPHPCGEFPRRALPAHQEPLYSHPLHLRHQGRRAKARDGTQHGQVHQGSDHALREGRALGAVGEAGGGEWVYQGVVGAAGAWGWWGEESAVMIGSDLYERMVLRES